MSEAYELQALRHTPIRDGDLVCLEGDMSALYSVILVREGRCWLRCLNDEMDTLAGVERCRRIGHEATLS